MQDALDSLANDDGDGTLPDTWSAGPSLWAGDGSEGSLLNQEPEPVSTVTSHTNRSTTLKASSSETGPVGTTDLGEVKLRQPSKLERDRLVAALARQRQQLQQAQVGGWVAVALSCMHHGHTWSQFAITTFIFICCMCCTQNFIIFVARALSAIKTFMESAANFFRLRHVL